MAFKIYGKAIEKESKKGISNLIVEALDKDLLFDDRLGSVITDKDGNFEIRYDKEDFQELFFDKKPDIYIRVRNSNGVIIHTTKDNVRYEAGKTEAFIVNISKNLIKEQKEEKAFRISGKVTEKGTGRDLQLITGLIVEALDKDILFDDRLGSVITDKDGNFEIIYDKEDFQELFFDEQPDIYLRVKSPDGKLICTTEDKVIYDVGKTEDFLIPIPAGKLIGYILPSFETTILRPQDMLKLEFMFINLELENGNLVRAYPYSDAYIVVKFPPQNIAEQAFFETDNKTPIKKVDDPDYDPKCDPDSSSYDPDHIKSSETPYYPVQSLISGPSRLVFKIPKDAEVEIPYTAEGLLEACSKYELNVAPTARPPSDEEFKKSTIDFLELVESVSVLKGIDPNNFNLILADTEEARNAVANLSIEDKSKIEAARAWCARSALAKYMPRASDSKIEAEIAAEIKGIHLGYVIMPPELRMPLNTETSIEAPFRLIISPNRYAAWAHSLKPVKCPVSERVELWHTRHAVWKDGEISGEIDEVNERLRRIRAIWTRDWGETKVEADDAPEHYNSNKPLASDPPFRMSLDAFDRHNIVHLSANYCINDYTPHPIDVNQLMLTSLGAWMNVRGAWPDTPLSVEEWRHRGTMGRDHYVRVVYKGYLFPFGHRASLVKITERKFHPVAASILNNAAVLFAANMDSYVKDIEDNPHPEVALFTKIINDNFDKTVTSLVIDIEGKSNDEIASLVKESKDRFHKETNSFAEIVDDKVRNEIISIANTAKDEFSASIDSVAGAIAGISYLYVPGNIAYLRQRMYIIVREPEKIYLNAGVKNPKGHSYDLQMPFNNLRITTLVTPNLDDPSQCDKDIGDKGQSLFWPRVGGNDFQFHLIAEDLEGKQIDFTAPLIFVEQSILDYKGDSASDSASKYNTLRNLLTIVQNEYSTKVMPDMNGQSITFADSGGTLGKTAFETPSLIFSAEIPEDYGKFGDLKQNLNDDDIPPFYPKVEKAEVIIPSIKHLTGNNQTAKIGYFGKYLQYGFDGNFNKGEVFAELDDGIPLDFNSQGDRSGGLVKPNMQIKGISRLMGPVSGPSNPGLDNIAGGNFNPKDFFSGLGDIGAKIFGAINLWDIIEVVGFDKDNNSNVPKLITDTSTPGELKVTFMWKPELQDWNNLFIASNGSTPASLDIRAELCAKSSGGEPDIDINCDLKNFSIDLIGSIGCSFIIIHFKKIGFSSKGGKKADVDVKMDDIEFVGVLSFVETLKDLIPLDGFSDPPSIDVTEKGISAGFSLGLPNIAVGVLNIQNISLGASFTVPFIAEPLSVRFNFCERQSPFILTVWAFGGGGFFAIALDPGGVQLLEASFEFGASLSVDLGVASGGVHIMAGIYFAMVIKEGTDKADLIGYFRMGGEVDVLGIISASIELYLKLHYESSSGKCVGSATITVEVEVLFFSASVEISCERKFAGSSGDPSFKEIMGPYIDLITEQEVKPWEEYCQAFA